MKIHYNKKNIYYIFLLLPFFFPATLGGVAYVVAILKVYKIIVGLMVIYFTLKQHEISLLLVLISCFYGVICLSALIHGLQIDNWIIEVLFLWLINYMTHDERSLRRFLRVYVNLYTILMLVNLFTMIAFPDGLYASSVYNLNWFLGYKNVIIRLLLPYLTLMLVRKVVDGRETNLTKSDKFLFGATIISILLSQSFNSLIGMAVFVFLVWRTKLKKTFRSYTISKAFALYCLTDFFVLKSNILSVFRNLIVNVLGRNASERARVAIWNRTIDMVSKSPLIGYGGITNEMYNFSFKISHPHNLLLYYFMLDGITGIAILFAVMIWTERTGVKNQTNKKMIINRLFAGMYIAYFAMGYMESLTGATMLIPMFLILYNINNMKIGSDDDESRLMHTI